MLHTILLRRLLVYAFYNRRKCGVGGALSDSSFLLLFYILYTVGLPDVAKNCRKKSKVDFPDNWVL